MASQFANMELSSMFLTLYYVTCLSIIFSYFFKYHVNIITGSGAMTIYFYKGLTKNPEIRNIPI